MSLCIFVAIDCLPLDGLVSWGLFGRWRMSETLCRVCSLSLGSFIVSRSMAESPSAMTLPALSVCHEFSSVSIADWAVLSFGCCSSFMVVVCMCSLACIDAIGWQRLIVEQPNLASVRCLTTTSLLLYRWFVYDMMFLFKKPWVRTLGIACCWSGRLPVSLSTSCKTIGKLNLDLYEFEIMCHVQKLYTHWKHSK